MKTLAQIVAGIRAREAGIKAAIAGQKIGANPYAEDDDCHWSWLDSWCRETSRISRSPAALPNTNLSDAPKNGGKTP